MNNIVYKKWKILNFFYKFYLMFYEKFNFFESIFQYYSNKAFNSLFTFMKIKFYDNILEILSYKVINILNLENIELSFVKIKDNFIFKRWIKNYFKRPFLQFILKRIKFYNYLDEYLETLIEEEKEFNLPNEIIYISQVILNEKPNVMIPWEIFSDIALKNNYYLNHEIENSFFRVFYPDELAYIFCLVEKTQISINTLEFKEELLEKLWNKKLVKKGNGKFWIMNFIWKNNKKYYFFKWLYYYFNLILNFYNLKKNNLIKLFLIKLFLKKKFSKNVMN